MFQTVRPMYKKKIFKKTSRSLSVCEGAITPRTQRGLADRDFFKLIENKDWSAALKLITTNPDLVKQKESYTGDTLLHHIVKNYDGSTDAGILITTIRRLYKESTEQKNGSSWSKKLTPLDLAESLFQSKEELKEKLTNLLTVKLIQPQKQKHAFEINLKRLNSDDRKLAKKFAKLTGFESVDPKIFYLNLASWKLEQAYKNLIDNPWLARELNDQKQTPLHVLMAALNNHKKKNKDKPIIKKIIKSLFIHNPTIDQAHDTEKKSALEYISKQKNRLKLGILFLTTKQDITNIKSQPNNNIGSTLRRYSVVAIEGFKRTITPRKKEEKEDNTLMQNKLKNFKF